MKRQRRRAPVIREERLLYEFLTHRLWRSIDHVERPMPLSEPDVPVMCEGACWQHCPPAPLPIETVDK